MVVVEHWFEELKTSVRWRAGLLRRATQQRDEPSGTVPVFDLIDRLEPNDAVQGGVPSPALFLSEPSKEA